LSPLLGGITAGQVNILVTALNTLPEHAWDQLIVLVRGLGPVTDSFVLIKQTLGFFPPSAPAAQPVPAPTPTPMPAPAPSSLRTYASAYPLQYNTPFYNNARNGNANNVVLPNTIPTPFNVQGQLFSRPSLFGRKMLQEAADSNSTSDNSSNSTCDPGMLVS